MRAGRLRHRVTILSVSETPDATYGGPEPATATLATRWARVRPLSTQERFAADQSFGTVDHEFTVRYDATLFASLGTEARISYDGRTFDVVGVSQPAEARREIVILAVERR